MRTKVPQLRYTKGTQVANPGTEHLPHRLVHLLARRYHRAQQLHLKTRQQDFMPSASLEM